MGDEASASEERTNVIAEAQLTTHWVPGKVMQGLRMTEEWLPST